MPRFDKPSVPRSSPTVRAGFGLRFLGPVMGALVAAGLVYSAGGFLDLRSRQLQADALGEEAEQLSSELGGEIRRHLNLGEAAEIERLLRASHTAWSDWSFAVRDATQVAVASSGPIPDGDLDGVVPLAAELRVGRHRDQPVVEFQRRLGTEQQVVGFLSLRRSLQPTPWLSDLPWLALAAAISVWLSSSLFLVHQFRSLKALRLALEGIPKEEFWRRVPRSGCGELRQLGRLLDEAMQSLQQDREQTRNAYLETVAALARTVEAKDRYTSGHSQRVARYAVEMGEWLGYDRDRLELLRLGAQLHDIGKVAVPDAILTKPGALDDEEFAEMKKHPMAGDRILSAIPGMRDIADIARSHHEKWNGGGYPMGVSGEAIPVEGRIVAIADAYDALVTKRSYKAAMPIEKALAIIEKDAGTHFDPELAQLFVAMKRNGKGYKALGPRSASPAEVGEPARATPPR